MESTQSNGFISERGTDDDDNQPQYKKQKTLDSKDGRKYVKAACSVCKTRHKRCDGEMPCGYCKKRNLQCGYIEEKAKRGPKPASFYHGIIQQLHDQVEYFKGNPEQNIPTSQDLFTMSSSFQVYIENFSYCVEALDVPTPNIDFQQMSNFSTSVPMSWKMKFYAVLAIGARLQQHFQEAERFFAMATAFEKDLFDQTDEQVATAFNVMAYYQSMVGNFDKAGHSLAVSRVKLQHLFVAKKLQLLNHFGATLVGSAMFLMDPYEALHQCRKARRLNCQAGNILFFCNVLEIHSLIVVAETENTPLDIVSATSMLDLAEIFASSTQHRKPVQSTFLAIYYAVRARYYQFMNNKELALHYGNKSLEMIYSLEKNRISFSIPLIGLGKLIPVYYKYGEKEKMALIYKKMHDIADIYPGSALLLSDCCLGINEKLSLSHFGDPVAFKDMVQHLSDTQVGGGSPEELKSLMQNEAQDVRLWEVDDLPKVLFQDFTNNL